jgi:GMC oxidoreductase
VGERIASFLIAVYHTCSERGQVKLASRDWRIEPLVEFNLLSDRRDLERLMQAFRRLGKLYCTPTMQAVTSDPFPQVTPTASEGLASSIPRTGFSRLSRAPCSTARQRLGVASSAT